MERSWIVVRAEYGGTNSSTELSDWEQPVFRFLRWWLYHNVWELLTKDAWIALDRRFPKRDTPFIVGQDLRCFEYERSGRVYTNRRDA